MLKHHLLTPIDLDRNRWLLLRVTLPESRLEIPDVVVVTEGSWEHCQDARARQMHEAPTLAG